MMKVMMVWYFVSQTLTRSWQYSIYHCVHFGFAGIDAIVTFIITFCAFWRYVPILKCIVDFLCLHTYLILKRHWVFLWGLLALQGSHRFEVPSGHRMRITEGPSGLTSYYFPATGQGNPASFRWMEKSFKILHICEVSELWKIHLAHIILIWSEARWSEGLL
jgi:hypothetical protein